MANNGSGNASGSTAAPPPPPPPPPPSSSGTKRPITPVLCPICKRNLYHEKALNGHFRWHSVEEREAAGVGIWRQPAPTIVVEEQDVSKRAKIPDLNRSPPPEDGEA